MAEDQTSEKTEQPTHRKLEEAVKKGQYARSQEIQTVMVLMGVLLALVFSGHEIWRLLTSAFNASLSSLHRTPISVDSLRNYSIRGVLLLTQCVWPMAVAAMVGGLVAGGLQSRFQSASEALRVDWGRLNPISGFKRLFSARQLAPTGLALLKLSAIIALTYGQIQSILNDPIFYSTVDVSEIGRFLAAASIKIVLRVSLAMVVIAALDYAFQFWKTSQDLMMTRQEVKEESKNSEGNPKVKARMRRMRSRKNKRVMLAEVRKADVVITNPTHLAVALRYDRRAMKAPRVVAKGARLNALEIRQIAKQNHVPVMENKPLARLLFKHAPVGGEIPAALYTAVAEVLAWVYRVNRYRYYAQDNQNSA